MSTEDRLVVRQWTEADLEGVFKLVDRENWGWELAEIRRIHALDSQSSLVAEEDGELKGLVTVIDYGIMAFIVHVIVEEGSRSRGLGKIMVKAALGRLDAKGIARVELHAMPDVLGFYNQLGFEEGDHVDFYSRDPNADHVSLEEPTGAERRVVLLGEQDLGRVSRLLSDAMDLEVRDVAGSLRADPPDVLAGIVEGGRVTGALVGKVGVELNGIGPWIMEDFDEIRAREMLRTVLARLPAKRTDVLIATANRNARDAIGSEGFYLVNGGLVRAIRPGKHAQSYPPGLLAIGHLGAV